MKTFGFIEYIKKFFSRKQEEEENTGHDALEAYLRKITAKDIMQSRGHMFAVNINDPIYRICHAFSHSDSSVIPVYENEIDRIIGAISYKQFLKLLLNPENRTNTNSLQDLIKHNSKHISLQRVLFVPQYIDCFLLLKKMKSQKVEMCVVIDEFGGTDGSITHNDITNLIFSEISEDVVLPVADHLGFFHVSGSDTLDSLENIVSQILITNSNAKPLLDKIEQMLEIHDTVNGFICSIAGRVPSTGEKVLVSNAVFIITDSNPRKIKKIKFCFDPFRLASTPNQNTKYIK